MLRVSPQASGRIQSRWKKDRGMAEEGMVRPEQSVRTNPRLAEKKEDTF